MLERVGRARRASPVVRLGAALLLGGALPLAAAGAASAEETGAPAPSVRCQVTDPALSEISGIVDLGEGFAVLNDGGEQVSVSLLDSSCRVVEVRTAGVDPYDPEDLALGADGTFWLADTGDNNSVRSTVALIALRPDGSAGVHRLTYPDGAHDAEALLLAPDGTPYVVTKEVLGSSGVYRPTAPMSVDAVVPMERVATVNLTLTGTPGGPVGRAGQLLVTGGAVAADGTALALRTYTDAYLWTLSGSDVVGALSGDPVRVALPASPQGEAISISADGSLLVASEGLPSDVVTVPVPAPSSATASPTESAALPGLSDLTTSDSSWLATGIVAVVAAGVLVWIAGLLFRRR